MSGIVRKKEPGQAWESLPDTGNGGSQTLAEVLVVGNDPDGTPIAGADGDGTPGGNVSMVGGGGNGSSDPSIIRVNGVSPVGAGGFSYVIAGYGASTRAGGNVLLQAGGGDDGNDPGAEITLQGGTGVGDAGLIILTGVPAADPGVPGALYHTLGALMISL